MRFSRILYAGIIMAVSISPANAYEAKEVHPEINNSATRQSNLDQYLREVLGFKNGIDTEIEDKEIIWHFKSGGTAEDEDSLARPLTHFHDPLQPWASAGLWKTTISALVWAQGHHADNEDADIGNVDGWEHARWAFYEALTHGNKPEMWAETFKNLGQVMHLNSDMAVPAHVRNDPHMEVMNPWYNSHFEKKTLKTLNSRNLNGLPFKPDMAIFNQFHPHDKAPFPISALWDSNKYTGDNPEITLGPAIGLAEYTNANFLSEGTIFSSYPNPAISDTNYRNIDWKNPEIIDAEDGKQDYRIYLYKYLDDGQTIQSHRLAALDYSSHELIEHGLQDLLPVILDDAVYNDYAAQLIPRAVGYSSALIDYFFRGRIAIQTPSITVDPEGSVTGLYLSIKNDTPPLDESQAVEPFGSGAIELLYNYVAPDGTKYSHNAGSIYILSDPADPVNFEYQDIAVDLSSEPVPVGAKDFSLTLVFRGMLGSEKNGVAARVYKFENSRIAYYHQPDGQPHTSNIYTISPDGSNPYQITGTDSPNPWFFTPAWSKDGTRLAFEEEHCTAPGHDPLGTEPGCPAEHYFRNIVVTDLLSDLHYPDNVLYELSNNGGPVANPSFSPDGEKVVALVQNQGGFYFYANLIVFDLTNNRSEIITVYDPDRTDLSESRPAWSPKGDRIAYYLGFRYDEGNSSWNFEGDLFLINPDGTGEVRLTNDDFINTQPAWSPDGEWIAYSSDRDGQPSMDIWIMDKNGDNHTKIYDCSPASCYNPTFSPDGQQVAFGNGSSIYTVNRNDPGSLKEIAEPGFATGGITWSHYLPPPSIEAQTEPAIINAFGTSTLKWQSHGAREVIISGIAERQPADGTIAVSPGSTTVYTLTAVGPTGAGETSVTVEVE